MLRHPELVAFAAQSAGRPTYVFPLFTSQQRYGILAAMQRSVDRNLRPRMSSCSALWRRTWQLRSNARWPGIVQSSISGNSPPSVTAFACCLEINNHVVSKLEIDDLFRSASDSIRSYFGHDLTGFWLLEKNSKRLQSVVLDFPDGKGLLAEIGSTDLTDTEYEKLRTRRAEIWSNQ